VPGVPARAAEGATGIAEGSARLPLCLCNSRIQSSGVKVAKTERTPSLA
jgi:hypothetical protein